MHPILSQYYHALATEGLPTQRWFVEEFSRTYTEVAIFIASRHDYHRLCRVVDRVAEDEPYHVPGEIRLKHAYRGGALVWFGDHGFLIGFASKQQAQNFCLYAHQWVLPKTGLLAHAHEQGILPALP